MLGFAVLDIPRTGPENMAVDEQMLGVAAKRKAVILRGYSWSRPTLSLGYFQRAADRSLSVESRNIEMIRRPTGGGAIVHHHDWTYSLAIPDILLESVVGASQTMYDSVHQTVVQWLSENSLEASQYPQSAVSKNAAPPFLCFERRSVGDVIFKDRKIMGSAQRRSRGALLQHGSLLLRRSEYAPSLPGIADLHQGPVERERQEQRSLPGPSDLTMNFRDSKSSPHDHQQVCHIPGLNLSDLFARLSGKITNLLGISISSLPSVESIDLDPHMLGKYAESSWLFRR